MGHAATVESGQPADVVQSSKGFPGVETSGISFEKQNSFHTIHSDLLDVKINLQRQLLGEPENSAKCIVFTKMFSSLINRAPWI